MENGKTTDFRELTDAQLSAFRDQLAPLVGADEARSIQWARRALLMPDGSWRLAYQRPKVGNLAKFENAPWGYPSTLGGPASKDRTAFVGMLGETNSLPLSAESVDLLSGGRNPERELERRNHLFDAAIEAADKQLARERQAHAQQAADERQYKLDRPKRWAAVPQMVKCVLLTASSPSDDPNHAMRKLARLLALPATDCVFNGEPPHTFEDGR